MLRHKKTPSEDRLIFVDSVWYFLSKAIPGVLAFLGIFLFNRMYGSEVFGQFSLLMAAAGTIAALSSSWLNQSQLKFTTYSADHARNDAVRIGAFLCLFIGLLASLIFSFFKGISLSELFILMPLSLVLITYNILLSYFMSHFKSKEVSYYEIARNLFYVLIPSVFFSIKLGVYGLGSGVILSYAAIPIFLYWRGGCAKVKFSFQSDLPTRDYLKKFFTFGWPLSISLGLMEAFRLVERIFLANRLNLKVLGDYVTVSEVVLRSFSLLFVPITLALHPRFMAFWNQGQAKRSIRLMAKAILFQLFIFSGMIFFFQVSGIYVFRLFFPNVGEEVLRLLSLICLSGFIWQLNSIIHKPLEATGRSVQILLGYSIAFCAQIIFYLFTMGSKNLIFFPIAQIIGSVCYTLWVCFVLSFYRKEIF